MVFNAACMAQPFVIVIPSTPEDVSHLLQTADEYGQEVRYNFARILSLYTWSQRILLNSVPLNSNNVRQSIFWLFLVWKLRNWWVHLLNVMKRWMHLILTPCTQWHCIMILRFIYRFSFSLQRLFDFRHKDLLIEWLYGFCIAHFIKPYRDPVHL